VSPDSPPSAAGAPPEMTAPAKKRAVLDTTIQLDRLKTAGRREHLEAVLAEFDLTFATSMSLVEFKATLIQECITIHNQLRRKGARFSRVRDALLEKQHPQLSLRMHIFNNLLDTFGSSHDLSPEYDAKLAEKARLSLENIIPRLYRWFVDKSVDVLIKEPLSCNRAAEAPRKKEAAFDTNLPLCRRGKNKTCTVENFLRQEGPALLVPLGRLTADSEQFQKTIQVIEKTMNDPKTDLSHGDCRRAGDTLIALEARGIVTHAISTNAREWRPLSEIMKMHFVHVTYPEEKTR